MTVKTVEQQNATQQEASETQATTTQGSESATEEEADPAAELEKWKKLARQNEARAKDNADKAKRFDQMEEANKTELEKATARAEAAEKAAIAAQRKAFAAEKQIPAELITGSTQDEWDAAAEAAMAWKGGAEKPAGPPAKGQGNVGSDVRETKDRSAEEIVAEATRR